MPVKRFSDFADEDGPLEGPKVRIDEIVNNEIKITGYKIKKSKYDKNSSGKYLTAQFEIEGGEKRVFFTGSDVLIEQMEKYGNQIPFLTIIKKIDRYYTFS